MSSVPLRKRVRDTGKGYSLPGEIVDVVGSLCSVRLASNGQLLTGVQFSGDRPEAGQKVQVDFTSGTPVALAGGSSAQNLNDDYTSRKIKRAAVVSDRRTIQHTHTLSGERLLTVEGDLEVVDNPLRIYNASGKTRTLTKVHLAVNTAPAGAAIIGDIHLDGVTVFTTQANRPQIAAGAYTGYATSLDVTSWPDGSYLTLHVDQVGSGTAGSDLTAQIHYTEDLEVLVS